MGCRDTSHPLWCQFLRAHPGTSQTKPPAPPRPLAPTEAAKNSARPGGSPPSRATMGTLSRLGGTEEGPSAGPAGECHTAGILPRQGENMPLMLDDNRPLLGLSGASLAGAAPVLQRPHSILGQGWRSPSAFLPLALEVKTKVHHLQNPSSPSARSALLAPAFNPNCRLGTPTSSATLRVPHSIK